MSVDQPHAESRWLGSPLPFWRFSLAEMMVIISSFAIGLSFWSINSFISVLLVIFCVLATARLLAAKRIANSRGIILSPWRQVLVFVYSLMLVFVGCVLYEIVVVALAVPVFLLFALLRPFVLPFLSETIAAVIVVLLWTVLAAIFLYVQFRFLRYTLRLKPS